MTLAEMFEAWRVQWLSATPQTENWFQENVREWDVLRVSDWPSCPQEISDFIARFNPRSNECYKNAYECAKQIAGVRYAEGLIKAEIAHAGISNTQYTNHAWNSFGEINFDLTPIDATSTILNPYLQLFMLEHHEVEPAERFVANGYYSFCLPYIKEQHGE